MSGAGEGTAYWKGVDALHELFNQDGCWPNVEDHRRIVLQLATLCAEEQDPEQGVVHAYDALVTCGFNGEATRFRKLFYKLNV